MFKKNWMIIVGSILFIAGIIFMVIAGITKEQLSGLLVAVFAGITGIVGIVTMVISWFKSAKKNL